ncbi:hypothetical protein NPIL_587771 [Nephila pilipes]|uniref:Uncharacterized protein n=1 Tax=Nephila pilipes TaxID=299642 RepID=A0A8X6R156_NEPPI|nr:hypothetical protein NPIL_587771 [Nephila pilipes]
MKAQSLLQHLNRPYKRYDNITGTSATAKTIDRRHRGWGLSSRDHCACYTSLSPTKMPIYSDPGLFRLSFLIEVKLITVMFHLKCPAKTWTKRQWDT